MNSTAIENTHKKSEEEAVLKVILFLWRIYYQKELAYSQNTESLSMSRDFFKKYAFKNSFSLLKLNTLNL